MTKKTGEIGYDKAVADNPIVGQVVQKNSWDYLTASNKFTVNKFIKEWKRNIVKNVKSGLWKKHRGIARDCIGLCKNKAIVAVGAGSSLNKNIQVLKKLHNADGFKDWEDRDFVIVASNHQYKPLLRMGIIPDFVVVVDASDVVYDQLCTDVPIIGQSTILLAAVHCSNKVLKEWDKQGRTIRFYITTTEGLAAEFEKASGKKAVPHIVHAGGNVLNTLWNISFRWFNSSTFICVGNDLSYPLDKDPDVQRKKYYADGDYSTNAEVTGTGRDEAKDHKAWMGFLIERSPIYTSKLEERFKIEIEPVGTTQTLWVCKVWLEGQVVLNEGKGRKFHYYNCSEGGILGVLCKVDTIEGRADENNWFLLDEVSKNYHTTTLEHAVNKFFTAKEVMKCRLDVQDATNLVKLI
jgi:hypothetical protein